MATEEIATHDITVGAVAGVVVPLPLPRPKGYTPGALRSPDPVRTEPRAGLRSWNMVPLRYRREFSRAEPRGLRDTATVRIHGSGFSRFVLLAAMTACAARLASGSRGCRRCREAALSSFSRAQALTGRSPAACSHCCFSAAVTRTTICSSRFCSSGRRGRPVRAIGGLYHLQKVVAARHFIEYDKSRKTSWCQKFGGGSPNECRY